jgi:hypothetical protein
MDRPGITIPTEKVAPAGDYSIARPAVQRLRLALLSLVGVRRVSDGYALHWVPSLISGRWFALLAITGYALLFLITVIRFPLFSGVATVDEQLIYYQTARNFVEYGFMASGLLHDLSTSSNPAHHPFIYSHMPPGPEIFVALLFKLAGESYAFVRIIFAGIFFLGMLYFFRFAQLVLQQNGLAGYGYAALFLSPHTILHAMDHPAYSPFPLFAFLPIVALHQYYQTGRRRHYCVALVVVFVASIYAVTLNFMLFLTAWLLVYVLRLIRLDLRHLVGLFAVGAAGILLHLLQGMWFLGPEVFFEELRITLSNRIFGEPSPAAVMEFYRAHDIVLHGTHRLDLSRSITALNNALRFPARSFFVALGMLLVAWGVLRVSRFDRPAGTLIVPTAPGSAPFLASVALFGKLGIWAAGAIILPLLVFPAYTGDYGLQGLGEFLLVIGAAAVLACAGRDLVAEGSRLEEARARPPWVHVAAWVVVALALLVSVAELARTQRENLKLIVHTALGSHPYADLVEIERRLAGQVVMTNVYPTTAGFFTQEAAFGGCELAAFGPDGHVDPSRCHAAFIRGYGRTAEVVPTHYVLFRERVFTGFTTCVVEACLEELSQRVAAHHQKVFETKLFTIFALKET